MVNIEETKKKKNSVLGIPISGFAKNIFRQAAISGAKAINPPLGAAIEIGSTVNRLSQPKPPANTPSPTPPPQNTQQNKAFVGPQQQGGGVPVSAVQPAQPAPQPTPAPVVPTAAPVPAQAFSQNAAPQQPGVPVPVDFQNPSALDKLRTERNALQDQSDNLTEDFTNVINKQDRTDAGRGITNQFATGLQGALRERFTNESNAIENKVQTKNQQISELQDQSNQDRAFDLSEEKFDFQKEQQAFENNLATAAAALTQAAASGNQIGISPITGKAFTETQSQAATFAARIASSEDILSLGRAGVFTPLTPGFAKSDNRKNWEQAEANFITAILRRESGAAIAPSEFDSARTVYIPVLNDSEEVLARKADARELALQGLKNESVGAYDQLLQSIPAKPIHTDENGIEYFDNPNGDDGFAYTQQEINELFGDSSFSQSPSAQLDGLKANIAGVESGGNYQALGPTVPTGQYAGQQALGKYQVMPGNLAGFNGTNNGWDVEALGRKVTAEEYINNPQIQEQIVGSKLAQLYQQYGNPQDVASVWHSGRPLAQATADGARDVNMSTADYVNKVINFT